MSMIAISRHVAGRTISIPVRKDDILALSFFTEDAAASVEEGNLVFSFGDGGRVELQGFCGAYRRRSAPGFAAGDLIVMGDGFSYVFPALRLADAGLGASLRNPINGAADARGAAPTHTSFEFCAVSDRAGRPDTSMGGAVTRTMAAADDETAAAMADGPRGIAPATDRSMAEYAFAMPASAAGDVSGSVPPSGAANDVPAGGDCPRGSAPRAYDSGPMRASGTQPGHGGEGAVAVSAADPYSRIVTGGSSCACAPCGERMNSTFVHIPGTAPRRSAVRRRAGGQESPNPGMTDNARVVDAAFRAGGARNKSGVNEACTFGNILVETSGEGGTVRIEDAGGYGHEFDIDGDGNLSRGGTLPPTITTGRGELSILCVDYGSIQYMYELTDAREAEGEDWNTIADSVVIDVHDAAGGVAATTLDIVLAGDAPVDADGRRRARGAVPLPVDAGSCAVTVAGVRFPLDATRGAGLDGVRHTVETDRGWLVIEALAGGTLSYAWTARADMERCPAVAGDSIPIGVTDRAGFVASAMLTIAILPDRAGEDPEPSANLADPDTAAGTASAPEVAGTA